MTWLRLSILPSSWVLAVLEEAIPWSLVTLRKMRFSGIYCLKTCFSGWTRLHGIALPPFPLKSNLCSTRLADSDGGPEKPDTTVCSNVAHRRVARREVPMVSGSVHWVILILKCDCMLSILNSWNFDGACNSDMLA